MFDAKTLEQAFLEASARLGESRGSQSEELSKYDSNHVQSQREKVGLALYSWMRNKSLA